MTEPVNVLRSVLEIQQRGDHRKAIAKLKALLRSDPDHPDALNLLAISLHAVGAVKDASVAIRKAISVRPDVPSFQTNAGALAVASGDIAAGLAHYRRALELDPNSADACNNLGAVLHRIGRGEQAELALRRALEIEPNSANALVNLGNVLRGLGKEDESIACYRRAIALSPNVAEAHNNLGNILKAKTKYSEAIESFDRALTLRPGYSEARYNRALTHWARGDVAAAKSDLEAAIALKPDSRYRFALAGLMPVIPRSAEDIAYWRKHCRDCLNALLDGAGSPSGEPLDAPIVNFYLAYHGEDDRDLLCLSSRVFRQIYPRLEWTAPWISQARNGARASPVRVGIFTTYLGDHAVTWTLLGLLARMFESGIDLRIFTVHRMATRMLPAVSALTDRIVYLPHSLERAREMMAAEEPDVLLYADIGMENLSYALAHARIAPVQCVLWGHPSTTGVSTIDYFISNDWAEPEGAEAYYSEQLIRLGGVQTCYQRPTLKDRADIARPSAVPDGATVYLCPQSLFKIHPDMDIWLLRILQRDPAGVLVLFAGLDNVVTDLMSARLRETFGETMDRVIFLPRVTVERFLEVIVLADVVLDTWPFGSGNTSYQAFAAGKPIVTLPGRFLRGRGVLAHYRHMDFMDCVAETPEQYVEIAVRLGTDREFRQRIIGMIQDRSHVLFDDTRVAEEVIRFLTEVAR